MWPSSADHAVPGRSIHRLVAAAAVVLLHACDDSPTSSEARAPAPARIVIAAPDAPIDVGSTHRVSASVLDAAGRPMTGEAVAWTSRDPTTATVDPAGMLEGMRTGEAWIVASAGTVSDSVIADVRHRLPEGGVAIRVIGDTERLARGGDATSLRADYLGREDGDFQVLQGFGSESASGARIGIVVAGPGRLQDGRRDVTPVDIELLDATADTLPETVVYVVMDVDPGTPAVEVVAAEEGTLELAYTDEPPGPGPVLGEVVSRLVARGPSYTVDLSGAGASISPTGRQYRIVADLRAAHEHVGIGNSDGTVIVGGIPLSWSRASAWRSVDDGSTTVDVFVGEHDLFVDFTWHHPPGEQAGTWSFRSVGGEPPAALGRVRHEGGDPPRLAFGSDGILRVHEVVPPTDQVVGWILGRVDALFLEPPSGLDEVQVSVDFAVPIPVSPAGTAATAPAPGREEALRASLLQVLGAALGGMR